MNVRQKTLAVIALALGCAGADFAQQSAPRQGRGGRGGFGPPQGWGWNGNEDDEGPIVRIEGGRLVDSDTVRTAREIDSHSTGTPEWKNPPGFEKDVFTFARIIFKVGMGRGTGGGWGTGRRFGWWVDFPDADLNFSYRLQQMTSMKVDPDARTLHLTDPDLADFPMVYMEHTGFMELREAEVKRLHDYLNNGGALFVNDFWSQREWDGFEDQMKRVLPGRGWTELTMEHPIFHSVFELRGPMNRLQIPTMQFWNQNFDPNDPTSRLSRVFRGEGSENMHVRAWFDDKGRMMVVAIHNSDVSDGWEREGENLDYFHTFSEKVAYPLGINIVFYLMTH